MEKPEGNVELKEEVKKLKIPKKTEEVTKRPSDNKIDIDLGEDEPVQQQQQQQEVQQPEQVQVPQQVQENIQPQQQTHQQEEEHDIVVFVVDPVVKDKMRNYIVYTVKGQDRDGPFEVIRRFSDFYSLKDALLKRWPGCYVPPCPDKKARGNFEATFVEQRRKQLQKFMQKVSDLKHLWYGEEMNVFLRSNSNDIENAMGSLPRISYDTLIKKYEEKFSFLSGKEINTDVIVNISNFTNYIKKVKDTLQSYKSICRNMIKEGNESNAQFETFTSFVLPGYEQSSLTEYLDGQPEGKLLFQENEKINEVCIKMKSFIAENEIENLYELLRYELRELESFQETMNIRGQYEGLKTKSINKKQELNNEMSNLMSNKTSIKGLFSNKNKNDQIQSIQNKIEAEDQNINNLTLICEIITVILGYVEIDRFRQEKVHVYYETIRKVAKYELEYNTTVMDLWKNILDNKNLL